MPSKRKQQIQAKRAAKKLRVTRPSGNSRYGQKAAAARKGEFSLGSPFRVVRTPCGNSLPHEVALDALSPAPAPSSAAPPRGPGAGQRPDASGRVDR